MGERKQRSHQAAGLRGRLREWGQGFGCWRFRAGAMSREGNVGSYSVKPAFLLGCCHAAKDHITPSRQPPQRPQDMLAPEPVLKATGTKMFFLLLHSFINIATLSYRLS